MANNKINFNFLFQGGKQHKILSKHSAYIHTWGNKTLDYLMTIVTTGKVWVPCDKQ